MAPAGIDTKRTDLRLKIGVVISDKRDRTRTVEVSFLAKEPKYGKYLTHKSKYQVHDPENRSKLGDQVEIANCRPISKTKSWRLVRILRQAADDPVGARG